MKQRHCHALVFAVIVVAAGVIVELDTRGIVTELAVYTPGN